MKGGLHQFVNSIYLYDDHFDLFFNFGYDARNLTFDDSQLADARKYKKRNSSLESSDMSASAQPKNRLATASLFFYPSRRLGISSAVRRYIIKGGTPPLYLITA